MKRQVRVMLKEKKRLDKMMERRGRFLSLHKHTTYLGLLIKITYLKFELEKWGVQ